MLATVALASTPFLAPASLALTLGLVGTSCSSAYYKAWEVFGWAKRDLLVDFVQKGRENQAEAKEQIQETYKTFQALTGTDGGELEVVYKRLSKDLDRSKGEADDVKKSIADIEKTATAMFTEWQKEIGEIQTPELRGKSESLLADTKTRYGKMIGAMRDAEGSMTPILRKFEDHVLFLKHNLNAKSVSDLQSTVDKIGGDVSRLIEDMESSIQEANDFIQSMESKGASS
ncbi:MAG: DUF2959 domain-containing protein [Planctomycetes bacterium]|nr:DUF2959 domain-containing protein [Planctomycetota bacterium]